LDNPGPADHEERKDKDMQSENVQSNEGNQKNAEPWMEVCELASREQNPERLMELTNQLIRLRDEKKTRPANPADGATSL
jgi:hypothetical protein